MKRKFLVVDTSFILSFMIPSEKHHNEAVRFINESGDGYDFIAPELLLIELASFLVRKKNTPSNKVFIYVEAVNKFVNIHANYASVNSVYDTIFKYKTRGADSIFVRLAERKNCEIITCDIDIHKKYDKCILIKE